MSELGTSCSLTRAVQDQEVDLMVPPPPERAHFGGEDGIRFRPGIDPAWRNTAAFVRAGLTGTTAVADADAGLLVVRVRRAALAVVRGEIESRP